MRGSVESFANLILYVLIFITAISSLIYVSHGTPMAQNDCKIAQAGIINDLKFKITEAKEKGVTIPYSFEILGCVKCLWYDMSSENLMVVYSMRRNFLSSEELDYTSYSISTNFDNIGCDCGNCDDKSGSDYCANIRNDVNSFYALEINRTHIRCVNCLATYKQCPTKYKGCYCPTGLCGMLNCGEIINSSLNLAGEEKYLQYTLSAPTNVQIQLTTNNGNYYGLSAEWDKESCPGSGVVWDCVDGGISPQTCNYNSLPAGTYYIRVSRNGVEPMNYSLSLTCS